RVRAALVALSPPPRRQPMPDNAERFHAALDGSCPPRGRLPTPPRAIAQEPAARPGRPRVVATPKPWWRTDVVARLDQTRRGFDAAGGGLVSEPGKRFRLPGRLTGDLA